VAAGPFTRVLRAAAAVTAVTVLTGCQPNRFVGGWIPHWGSSSGQAPIANTDVAKLFGEISPFWHGTATNGSITNMGSLTSMNQAIATSRAQGLPVIPSIADTTPAPTMLNIMSDPIARANHIQNIVNLVISRNYDGIDLDYEVFAFGHKRDDWPAITGPWVTFVRELSAVLHANGKLLSVTIPPVWTSDGTASGSLQGYTVYAQRDIIGFVDRLRLMVYDWSVGSPGPIGPMSWVNNVIGYTNRVIPAEARRKMQLGVPTYGRHWETQLFSNEICPDGAVTRASVLMRNGPSLAAANGQTPVRHISSEMTFGWTEVVTGPRTAPIPPPPWPPLPSVIAERLERAANAGGGLLPAVRLSPPSTPVTCTIQHTVFYPDGVSIRQRADAALAAGWSGIVMWAMGYESVDVYEQLAGVGAQRPNGAPGGVLDALTTGPSSLRVTGYAFDPQFDLPVPVRIQVTGPTAWTQVASADVERGGMPEGLGAYHGIDEQRTVAPGSYTVCATLLGWGGGDAASLGCQSATVTG
jgi:hypothetical protein